MCDVGIHTTLVQTLVGVLGTHPCGWHVRPILHAIPPYSIRKMELDGALVQSSLPRAFIYAVC